MSPITSIDTPNGGLAHELAGHRVRLLAERALHWEAGATLVVADPHFGKAATFRAHGIPVPEATTTATLDRLARALAATGAERVVFLGDFLHHRTGRSAAVFDALGAFRDRHRSLAMVLVRGNHDGHAGDPPAHLRIVVADAFADGPFAFVHHPEVVPGLYALAGHVHPCYVLGDGVGPSVRLPCFLFGPAVGVLPAFGDFTGMHPVRPQPGDRAFVMVDDRVLAVPAGAK